MRVRIPSAKPLKTEKSTKICIVVRRRRMVLTTSVDALLGAQQWSMHLTGVNSCNPL